MKRLVTIFFTALVGVVLAVLAQDAAQAAGGGTISGTVEGENGQALASAWVYVYDTDNPYSSVASVSTDSNGLYSISGLPAGDYLVSFNAPYQSFYLDEWYENADSRDSATALPVADGVTTTADAALELGGRITGTITDDATGQPVPGAYVYVYGDDPYSNVAYGYAGQDGTFTTDALPAGDYKLRINAPSQSAYLSEWYADAQTYDLATEISVTAGADAPVSAGLAKGLRITGTITDEDSGQPISGVNINVYTADDQSNVGYAYTGSDGKFITTALPPGTYKVRYDAPYQSSYLDEWYDNQGDFDDATPIQLTTGDVAADAELSDGLSITGKVVSDLNGQPLSGVNVSVYKDEYWSVAYGSTGPDGTFTTSGLPPGEYKVKFNGPYQSSYLSEWYDDKSGYQAATPVTLSSDDVEVNASLALGSRITGKISVPGGSGLPNAYVRVYSASNQYSQVAYGYTDQAGVYVSEAMPPGNYKVIFEGPYKSPYLSEWFDDKQSFGAATVVKLATPGTDVTADATLARGSVVTGKVTATQGGQPLDGVSVDIEAVDDSAYRWAYTDSNGNFSAGGLPPGDYKVSFSPRDRTHLAEWFDDKFSYSDADVVTLQAGQDKTIDADLAEASHLVGTVSDAQGNPVRAQVRAYGDDGYESARTAADGTYDIGGLRAGAYTLRIIPDEPSDLASEWWDDQTDETQADTITLGAQQTLTRDVVLDSGAVITGTVRDDQNSPVEGVTVKASGAESESAVTDSNGEYRLAGLEPGDYRVRFRPIGTLAGQWFDGAETKLDATVVSLTPGESKTDVDADLRQARSIGGIVTDPDGNPVPDVRVEVYEEGSSYYTDRTTTDDQGAFRTGDLPVGNYRVYVRPSSPTEFASQWYDKSATRGSATPVSISVGQSQTIAVELERGATITGTVTGPGGTPVADALVSADRDGDYRYSRTDSSGNYAITGLSSGDYTVEFSPGTNDLVMEWYDNKDVAQLADPVSATAGQTTADIDAQLARAGSISGTVRTADGDTLVYSYVWLYDGDEQLATSWVGQDGTYSFTGLRSGKYTMYTMSNGEWLAQWWKNKPDQASADVIDLAPGQDLTGQDFTLARGGSISGTVTDSNGQAVSGNVEVTDADGDQVASGDVQGGSYRVVGLRTGTYYVHFRTWAPDWLSEWWQDKPNLQAATPVSVTVGQEVTGIDAMLSKASKIRGTVVDGQGNPVRACVSVFRGTSDDEAGYDCTGSDGTYVVGGLVAGDYQVRFDPYSGDFARQWWDGAARRTGATTIALGTATEYVADATVLKGGTLTGLVTDEQGAPVGGVQIRAYTSDDDWDATAVTDGQGRYTMAGLNDEDYRIQAVPGSSRLDLVSEWFDDKPNYANATVVPLQNGSTITANFELEKGATISGVVTDDKGPVAGIGIDVFDLDGNKSLTVWTNLLGKYTSTALKPGKYKVRFMPGYYGGEGLVEQWWNNKDTEATADVIDLGDKEQRTGVDAKLRPIGTAKAPGAPTDVQVATGDEELTVTWKAPIDNGGLPITRYKVDGTPYGECETLGDLSCTIKGLDNGLGFTFTVQAANSAGLSPKSAPSSSVKPFGKPKPPKSVNATAGQESATVSWTPGQDNGSPIIDYVVTSSPGDKTCTTAQVSCSVSGLSGGVVYTFTVRARNLAGLSEASLPSAAVTPTSAPVVPAPPAPPGPPAPPASPPSAAPTAPPGPPAKPAKLKVAVKKGKATVTWAPVLGATGYEVRVYAVKAKKGSWKKVTKTTYSPRKLKKGSYIVEVRAVGPAGSGSVVTKRFKVK